VISVDEVKQKFLRDPVVLISALKNEGIDLLKDAIYKILDP